VLFLIINYIKDKFTPIFNAVKEHKQKTSREKIEDDEDDEE
jgi:hypothetical protein